MICIIETPEECSGMPVFFGGNFYLGDIADANYEVSNWQAQDLK